MPAPACIANSIAVGAVRDANVGSAGAHGCGETAAADKVTCWSNSNSMVDLFAPSAPTTSAGLGGGNSTFYGTSQASPLAASCAALLREGASDLTADELEVLLEGPSAIVTDVGNGLAFPRLDCLETWEPCGHPLVQELECYPCTGIDSVEACERISAAQTTVESSAVVILTAGRVIELADEVSVSGTLTLAINPAWAINP